MYLGDDLWRGDNVPDEGSSGLGRTVSDRAGTVQHKVLFYPSCQVFIPARLPGRKERLSRDRQPGHSLFAHLPQLPESQRWRALGPPHC